MIRIAIISIDDSFNFLPLPIMTWIFIPFFSHPIGLPDFVSYGVTQPQFMFQSNEYRTKWIADDLILSCSYMNSSHLSLSPRYCNIIHADFLLPYKPVVYCI
ncbi:hypothetical protein BDV29DRAFT_30908 [Aspergillus leporis]|uniref:Uncharacterized protein n=1 Tax=Aspergillus leporis TaxID=41062 RepID=A0A5N5WU50_9EURO|nr:hypothetical protein BDV29DRAFT_30908 [Aspergillus leporis]